MSSQWYSTVCAWSAGETEEVSNFVPTFVDDQTRSESHPKSPYSSLQADYESQ